MNHPASSRHIAGVSWLTSGPSLLVGRQLISAASPAPATAFPLASFRRPIHWPAMPMLRKLLARSWTCIVLRGSTSWPGEYFSCSKICSHHSRAVSSLACTRHWRQLKTAGSVGNDAPSAALRMPRLQGKVRSSGDSSRRTRRTAWCSTAHHSILRSFKSRHNLRQRRHCLGCPTPSLSTRERPNPQVVSPAKPSTSISFAAIHTPSRS